MDTFKLLPAVLRQHPVTLSDGEKTRQERGQTSVLLLSRASATKQSGT